MNENMLCTKTHEYVIEKDGNYEIGITDFAIEQLGDIVFIELPEAGSSFSKNEVFATIESVKAASEIYMPISGKVLEINESIVVNNKVIDLLNKGYKPGDIALVSTFADVVTEYVLESKVLKHNVRITNIARNL